MNQSTQTTQTTGMEDVFAALRARIDQLEARIDELLAKRKATKLELTATRKALRTLGGESGRRKKDASDGDAASAKQRPEQPATAEEAQPKAAVFGKR